MVPKSCAIKSTRKTLHSFLVQTSICVPQKGTQVKKMPTLFLHEPVLPKYSLESKGIAEELGDNYIE